MQQRFLLRYLLNLSKATGLSKAVILRMDPEHLMKIEYAIQQIGSLSYYLAPTVDDRDYGDDDGDGDEDDDELTDDAAGNGC